MHAREQPLVRELVPTVSQRDGRQADVFIRGMRIGNGMPVVGDMCMGSALHANGTPHDDAATVDGKTIERLTRDKYNKYSELVASDRVRYVMLAYFDLLILLGPPLFFFFRAHCS